MKVQMDGKGESASVPLTESVCIHQHISSLNPICPFGVFFADFFLKQGNKITTVQFSTDSASLLFFK